MAEQHLPQATPRSHARPEVRHETSDINIRAVLGFGGGLVLASVFIYFLVWLMFQYFSARDSRHASPEYPLATAQETRVPPEPRLQTNPRQDLEALLAKDRDVLTSYGWVDKNAGIVRIPIEEAMKLIVQRGLPSRPESK